MFLIILLKNIYNHTFIIWRWITRIIFYFKIVVRELKTSTGKVLTKDSEYTLVERKKYVTVGKKTQIDYVFELDLKEEGKAEGEENKQ